MDFDNTQTATMEVLEQPLRLGDLDKGNAGCRVPKHRDKQSKGQATAVQYKDSKV